MMLEKKIFIVGGDGAPLEGINGDWKEEVVRQGNSC